MQPAKLRRHVLDVLILVCVGIVLVDVATIVLILHASRGGTP
jgi:hypothetical protein